MGEQNWWESRTGGRAEQMGKQNWWERRTIRSSREQ
jgi:hypothetical protein